MPSDDPLYGIDAAVPDASAFVPPPAAPVADPAPSATIATAAAPAATAPAPAKGRPRNFGTAYERAQRTRDALAASGVPLSAEHAMTPPGRLNSYLADHLSKPTPFRNFSTAVRTFMEEKANRSGKTILRGYTGEERLVSVLRALHGTATNPKSKNQVAAAMLLLQYAYGKPKASEEDIAAVKKGGLTLVYVSRPEIDPDIPIAKSAALAAPAAAPEFIDAEVEEVPDGRR